MTLRSPSDWQFNNKEGGGRGLVAIVLSGEEWGIECLISDLRERKK